MSIAKAWNAWKPWNANSTNSEKPAVTNVPEQLEREMHELQQRLNAPRDGERPGPPPELQTRLEHLHVAMENLRAAGLHDEAQHIAEQIERIAHEHHPGPPERHDPDMRPPWPPRRTSPRTPW